MLKIIWTVLLVSPLAMADVVGQHRDWYVVTGPTNHWSAAPYLAVTLGKKDTSILGLSCRDRGEGYGVYVELTLPVTVDPDLSTLTEVVASGSAGFEGTYAAYAEAVNGTDQLRLTIQADEKLADHIVKGSWLTFSDADGSSTYSLLGSTDALSWLVNKCPIGVQGPHKKPSAWTPQHFEGSA